MRQAELVKILTAQFTTLTGGLPLPVTFSVCGVHLVVETLPSVMTFSAVFVFVDLQDDLSKNQVFKDDVKSLPSSTPNVSAAINEMIADKDQFRVTREGWLSKQARTHDTWKRRFFRLCDNNILYYEAKQKVHTDMLTNHYRMALNP